MRTTLMHQPRSVLAVLLALMLLLAACGGDDDPAAAPEPADEAPETPEVDEPDEPDEPDEAATEEPEADDEVAEFYSGETFRIVVGLSAGGGYDVYARAIAAHLGDHIPGNPNVIVENMPGAGSLVATNQLYGTLPDDGTVIGHFVGGLLTQQVLGNPATQFEAREFNYVGAPVADTATCVVRTDAGVDGLEDLRDRDEPLVFGGPGPGTNSDDIPTVLAEFFGLNVDLVSGYDGTAEMRVALEQGEIDAACWAWESQRVILAEELEAGELQPFAQAGETPHPDNPDVSMFIDLAETDEEEQIITAAINSPMVFARPFVAPPGVPEDRVATLQQAFADTLEDPAFLERAEEANLAVDPISGEELQAQVDALYDLPEDLRQQLADALLPPE